MFRRLVQLSLAAVLGAVGLPVLAAGGNVAGAVETAQCASPANVFTSIASNPDFRLRRHNDAASGSDAWTGDQGIGWGWDTRFFAGANGHVFSITAGGDLHRYRWNGTAWDNGGTPASLGAGWSPWNQPAHRYRITADSNNNIYRINPTGELVLSRYDETTKAFTHKAIATGWTKYDQLFAAGDGVFYTRDPNVNSGTLYRSQYDFRTGTWIQREKDLGWGWNGFKQLVSPGADVIYGMVPGGELWWYRYLPAQDTWAGAASGEWKVRIAAWTDVDEIAPASDGCKLGAVAPDVECKPSANVFASTTDSGLWLRPHGEPETGLSNWNGPSGVGSGWNTRFITGPNGYTYLVRADGAVDRFRWNGATWDDNGVSVRIATNWYGWNDAVVRYRLTVDTNNHFYGVLINGELEHSIYDDVAKTWTQKVVDTGWGRFDQVFAAGDGVLYARDPAIADGTLYRFHYDWKNRRWLDYGTHLGSGWNGFKQLASPGADVIYGLGNSDIYWYRWDAAAKTFANSAEGTWKEHVLHWPGISEFGAAVDSCKLVSPVTVTPPTVPAPSNERPQLAFNPGTQRFEMAAVTDSGTLVHGYQSSAGSEFLEWNGLSGYQTTAGRPTLAQRQDGRFVILARNTGAQAVAFTQKTTGSTFWDGPAGVNGAMSSGPVVVRGANNLLTAFAVDDKNKLWYAEEFDDTRGFRPWRKAVSSTDYNMSTDFTVVPSGNGFEVVYRSTANVIAARKLVNGEFGPGRVAAGISGAGTPAAVVFADGKVQIVTRATDNKLYTQKEGTSFAGWTNISGTLTFAGSPAAIVNAHGIVEAVVRGSDGFVYRGGQTVPGASTWRLWHTNEDPAVGDPAFAGTGGSEERVLFRGGDGNYFLWQVTAYTSNSGTALSTAPGATSREVVTIKSSKGKVPDGK
ncbi:tachylectin-related carbohydrate-binding protein [Saccharothrix hoggarensis]|uniref:Tachylectin-related carbohydrate-binding protein n=1 Tax=Saccharothrix hoggarensis TaxID=913853 RepID=A0ABW3QXK0_9PSEU